MIDPTSVFDRPIAFQRGFVSLGCGITGALMLSQAVYWSKRTNDSDGWFYKTAEEWEEETGLTRREQETARTKLSSIGVLCEMKKGLPCKLFYRVDFEQLLLMCGYRETSLHKSAKQESTKAPNSSAQKRHSSTENTTETTTDTSGTSADAPCSVCGGTLFVGAGIECHRCNGTGKEPDVRNSRTTELTGNAGELPGAAKSKNPDAGIDGRSSAAGDTNKPTRPKKPTKAQALFNLVRENPTQWPALNCVDDTLLMEWAKLRTRKGASSEQRALNTIEKTLDELRTVHGIAPDTALAAQCDAGWATVKVEYLVKNGRGMSYAGKPQSPYDDSSDFRDIMGDML